MKFYIFLFVFSIIIQMDISANDNAWGLDRIIFERISYDGGENWEPAMCHHIKLGKRGINCEAILPESTRLNINGDKESFRFEAHSKHRFIYTTVTESGDSINEVLEFSGNVIKHNGIILALMDKGITSVSLYTPEMKAFIVLHSGLDENEAHPLAVINEIAGRISQITQPALEVKAFPNPLVGTILNLKSNIQVFKTVIYDTTGRIWIIDYEPWNIQRSISLDRLPPGNYFIDCYSEEHGKSPNSTIKILKQ